MSPTLITTQPSSTPFPSLGIVIEIKQGCSTIKSIPGAFRPTVSRFENLNKTSSLKFNSVLFTLYFFELGTVIPKYR